MIKLKDILNEKGNRVERYSIFKEVKNQVTVVIAYPDKKGKYTEHDFMEGEGWDWDIFDYAPNKNKAAAMLKKELRKL